MMIDQWRFKEQSYSGEDFPRNLYESYKKSIFSTFLQTKYLPVKNEVYPLVYSKGYTWVR